MGNASQSARNTGRTLGPRGWRLVLPVLALASLVRADDTAQKKRGAEASFMETVQPILRQHCYACHSHQAKQAKGGLVLDSRGGWRTGGESGPAIVPGKPEESLLIQAVRYGDLEMPPKGKLPEELIKRLERWVADGAHDPRVSKSARQGKAIDLEAGRRHWAFQPPREAWPPQVKDHHWPRNGIDRYILAKLEAAGLRPVRDADRFTWLRRVSFDLTGLPPTIEEIRAFTADRSPRAREKVVDRLLGSRAFGERWARHWLDLVGYADQIGTSNSVFAQYAWRYRDYVIDAYNNDKPFGQFVREQIAGDLLEHDEIERRAAALTATGFLVLGDVEIVEADKTKLRVDIVDQQLNKVGKAFLGMTLECARCHDHKFDPIPQRDYYALAGIFHATSSVYKTKRGVWSDVHVLELPETEIQSAHRVERQEQHAAQLRRWREERDRLAKDGPKHSGRIAQLERQIQHAEFFAPTVPRVHGVKDVENPEDMRITIRGNPRALGQRVPRGFLQVASSVGSKNIPRGQSGRRELADWIAGSPLAARVAVNRIWQKLFGEGIVRTVDYFGLPGERPTHPELLDHLAGQFLRERGSPKRLIRSLVLSRTYGLASAHDAPAHAADPANRWLWRMNRTRLDAEALRDAMIFASGQLKPSGGGPAMPLEFPENVGGLNPKDVNPPNFRFTKWRPGQKVERTVYLPVIRHAAQPAPAALRNVFDFAQPSQFTGQRAVTAVPTQALFLMNSPVIKKHAAALAERMKQEPDETKRCELLWLTLLNRPITDDEQRETLAFLRAAGQDGWTELCHAVLASNEFLIRM